MRVLLSYDVTDSIKKPKKNALGTSNIFVMKGVLFEEFNTGVDFSFVGRMNDSYAYEKLVMARLPDTTKVDIDYEGTLGRSLFNRPVTRSFYLIGVKPAC